MGNAQGNRTKNALTISLNPKGTHSRTQGGRMAKHSEECMGNGSHEGTDNLTELNVERKVKHGKRARKQNRECREGMFSRTHSERQVSKTADWLRNFYKDACAQR